MTEKLREAARQALEALKESREYVAVYTNGQWQRVERNCQTAITALRAAMAEQTVPSDYLHSHQLGAWLTKWANAYDGEAYTEWQKGYDAARSVVKTHLPALAEPEQEPVADEEIVEAVREADLDWQAGWTLDEREPNRFTTLARIIERKVRGEA